MLKRITIKNYGPFVFGRKESQLRTAPQFITPSATRLSMPVVDHDAIRIAAKSLHPIYRAEEDILDNNIAGDCTCAGILHIAAILQGIKGGLWRLPTGMDALTLYTKVTNPPYDITTGENDNGASLADVLAYVAENGAYPDGTFKISNPMAVDAMNTDQVKSALDTHRCLYMGASLADAWVPKRDQPVASVWDVAGDPDRENGHCTCAYSYNDQGVQIDTWGCFVTVTWAALAKYWGAQSSGELFTFDLVA